MPTLSRHHAPFPPLTYFTQATVAELAFAFFFYAKYTSFNEEGEQYSYADIFNQFREEFDLEEFDPSDGAMYKRVQKLLTHHREAKKKQ